MIKEVLNKLLCAQNVSETEYREVFDEIFQGLSHDVEISSFLTALKDTNLEFDVLLEAINSSFSAIKTDFSVLNSGDLIENIYLCQSNNLINIALLQDLICTAAELPISRYCFDGVYSKDNAFQILNLLGFDFNKEIDYNSSEFEKLNFNYFYLSTQNPYFKYSENVRASLPFDNLFNKTIKFLNPLKAKNLFLGVSNREDVDKYATLALKLNKVNSVIVNGAQSLPFITPWGESYIAEAWKNKIFTYVLTPELLGFDSLSLDEIKCVDNKENARDILEIISNKKKGAKYNVAIMNSALSLYISKKTASVMDGINLAKKLLKDGLVEEKFNQIKAFYS